jgi:hypothetical protein
LRWHLKRRIRTENLSVVKETNLREGTKSELLSKKEISKGTYIYDVPLTISAFGHLVNLKRYVFIKIKYEKYNANVPLDTEKISMAPALRMTRSYKEIAKNFLLFLD